MDNNIWSMALAIAVIGWFMYLYNTSSSSGAGQLGDKLGNRLGKWINKD